MRGEGNVGKTDDLPCRHACQVHQQAGRHGDHLLLVLGIDTHALHEAVHIHKNGSTALQLHTLVLVGVLDGNT